jgi:serine/threonine-protein kinase
MAVIDGDRWRQLEPLLDQALELNDEERGAWLDQLSSRSPELAAELMALLAAEAKADRHRFLHQLPEVPSTDSAFGPADLSAYLQSALGDQYAIERELGGGGMGRVFLAHERALGRAVVIKVLLPPLAAGVRAERFAREVRVAAALQHPNVVPIFTAGSAGGLPYYVMPYVRGESLRVRLTRNGQLALADTLSVLRDVARALMFAHEEGIVHRDVKPENVLLSGDAAVVTDFGIAKAVAAAADADDPPRTEPAKDLRTLSTVGSVIGTPAYMAPEQAAGDPRVDHRADLYAWGILAYELLAGAHPFSDRLTPQELLAAQLTEIPTTLTGHVPGLSPELADLVRRCLEKDPARRPQSVRDILDVLVAVTMRSEERVAVRRRSRAWVTRAVVASVLVTAAIAYGATARLRQSASPVAAPSLAVLPFDDFSGDTANAYFGEGIADEIAVVVSKAGGVRVASPTSVGAFRSTHRVDVRELGRRLGVGTVLEGRVWRSGDRLRLTVQLTSVADGMSLWSDVYERRVTDVFAVQDEIARSIVGALRVSVPGMSAARPGRVVASPGTSNPDAYDLYLRGNYLLERRGSGVAKAVEYFERAIAEDSAFARAYAGLGYALEVLPSFGGPSTEAVERRAMDAAHRALAIDSTLAEAYVALGLAHVAATRWQEAGDAFRHAIAADPDYARALYHYGHYLMRVGLIADAEVPIRRARNADPLSGTPSVLLTYVLSLLGRYDESLAESRRAYELDSSLAVARSVLPLAVLASGRPAEARGLVRGTLPLPFSGIAAYVLGATGDRAGALAIVRELEARPRGQWYVASALGYAYLGVGDTARALSALEAAAVTHERPTLTFADPVFDPVRQSRRFAAVVTRYGLDVRRFTSPRAERRGQAPGGPATLESR